MTQENAVKLADALGAEGDMVYTKSFVPRVYELNGEYHVRMTDLFEHQHIGWVKVYTATY